MTPEERINFVVNRAFGGWHHVSNRKPNAHGVQFNVYGDISTFDSAQLTRLTIACHAVHVRAQISPCNPQLLRVYLHPRVTKEVNDYSCEYNPGLQDLIAKCNEEEAREVAMTHAETEAVAVSLLKRTDHCHAEIVTLPDEFAESYAVVAIWPDETVLVDTFKTLETACICEAEINRQISALGWKSGREG